jgi:hypothetical protein
MAADECEKGEKKTKKAKKISRKSVAWGGGIVLRALDAPLPSHDGDGRRGCVGRMVDQSLGSATSGIWVDVELGWAELTSPRAGES